MNSNFIPDFVISLDMYVYKYYKHLWKLIYSCYEQSDENVIKLGIISLSFNITTLKIPLI